LKIIILGCGNIGSVIAEDLADSVSEVEITIADAVKERAEAAASRIDGVNWLRLDATDHLALVETLEKNDLAIGALPGDYGYRTLQAAIKAGVGMVDVSFTPENPLELDRYAKNAEVTIIPDCGVAPGLSNMLIGFAASKLDRVREAHIMVGGIPEYFIPPLGYTITWSVEGLIDEYMRDVKIIQEGDIVQVPALSGLEEIEFPEVGKLEAFFTDGLRTLVHSFPNAWSMWEKTLRYPGHIEKIRLLKELGFFSESDMIVGSIRVSPRLMTAKILERSLTKSDVPDILAMTVEVAGEREGTESKFKYYLLDRYDRVRRVTAMARTTAYTASVVAQKLIKGAIKEKGIVPPERLGMNSSLFRSILSDLMEKGVRIKEVSI